MYCTVYHKKTCIERLRDLGVHHMKTFPKSCVEGVLLKWKSSKHTCWAFQLQLTLGLNAQLLRHGFLNLADTDWQCFGLNPTPPCCFDGFTGITEEVRGSIQCTTALTDTDMEKSTLVFPLIYTSGPNISLLRDGHQNIQTVPSNSLQK